MIALLVTIGSLVVIGVLWQRDPWLAGGMAVLVGGWLLSNALRARRAPWQAWSDAASGERERWVLHRVNPVLLGMVFGAAPGVVGSVVLAMGTANVFWPLMSILGGLGLGFALGLVLWWRPIPELQLDADKLALIAGSRARVWPRQELASLQVKHERLVVRDRQGRVQPIQAKPEALEAIRDKLVVIVRDNLSADLEREGQLTVVESIWPPLLTAGVVCANLALLGYVLSGGWDTETVILCGFLGLILLENILSAVRARHGGWVVTGDSVRSGPAIVALGPQASVVDDGLRYAVTDGRQRASLGHAVPNALPAAQLVKALLEERGGPPADAGNG